MLEPAVRPGLVPSGKVDQGKPAFENRSFQDLLSEASNVSAQEGATSKGIEEVKNPLDMLGGFGQIENAALRSVLARTKSSATEPGVTE